MEVRTLIAGVLLDIHGLGLRVLKGILEQRGFNVCYIGVGLVQEDFIRAAIETNAAAILVSTSTGHAEVDCRGMREKCEEAGLNNILLYVGGNLLVGGVQGEMKQIVEENFKDMGFNRVYWPDSSVDEIVAALKSDLGI